MLCWLFEVLIWFNFLVARILNGPCILGSNFLISSSVSIINSVQYFTIWKCVHGCEQCSKMGETF
jgi:hypothetical protein